MNAAVETLQPHGSLLVRRVAARGDDCPVAMALYSVAAGDRLAWTEDDWNTLLAQLDADSSTIRDWLALRV